MINTTSFSLEPTPKSLLLYTNHNLLLQQLQKL